MNIGWFPKIATGLFLLSTLLVFPACKNDGDSVTNEDSSSTDSSSADDSDEGGLTGTISIDGSSTVAPFSIRAADQFQQEYPDVKPTVGVSGTGGGFKRFYQGEIDISNASRPIKADELEKCKQNKVDFIEVPIAYDGLTIVVNPANDWVEQLTVAQLRQIFLAGGATTWSELHDGWPNEKLQIFSPGTDSGTFDYFKEVIAGKEGSIRSDLTASEDDNVLVNGVAGEKNAVGYFGAAYYFANKDKLKAVPIVNPETEKPVLPDANTIRTGEYAPFSRPLFVYVNLKSLRRPEVKKFMNFQLEHAPEFAERVQYVPLQDEIYAAAKDHLSNRITGTHFQTADGNKREGTLTEIYRAENVDAQQ